MSSSLLGCVSIFSSPKESFNSIMAVALRLADGRIIDTSFYIHLSVGRRSDSKTRIVSKLGLFSRTNAISDAFKESPITNMFALQHSFIMDDIKVVCLIYYVRIKDFF